MNLIQHNLILMGKDVKWLAKQLKTTHQTVYNWSNGKTKPRPQMIPKLSTLLGIPVDKLYSHFFK